MTTTILTTEQLESMRTLRANDPAMFKVLFPNGVPELDAPVIDMDMMGDTPKEPAPVETKEPADLGPILPKTVLIYSPANGWVTDVKENGAPVWSKKRDEAFKFDGERGLSHLKVIKTPDATLRRVNGKSFGFSSSGLIPPATVGTTPEPEPVQTPPEQPEPVQTTPETTPAIPPVETNEPAPVAPVETNEPATPVEKKVRKFKLLDKDRSVIRFLWRCLLEGKDYGVFVPGDEQFDATCRRLENADYLTLYAPIDAPDDHPEDHFKFTALSTALFVNINESSQLIGDPAPDENKKKPTTYTLEELASMRKARPKAYAKLLDENGVVRGEFITKPKMISKAEAKRRDAIVGENILANKESTGEPWMADTLPAKLCRLADREVMTVRDVISYGNLLERTGIDPKELTEEVIRQAERLTRSWWNDVQMMIDRYNRMGVEINRRKGFKVDETPTPVATPPKGTGTNKTPKTPVEKKEEKAPKAKKETPTKDKKEKTGGGGKHPINLGGDTDHSMTAVFRWIGGRGYDVEHIHALLKFLKITGVSEATIKSGIYYGARGDLRPEANLNDDEAEVLLDIIDPNRGKKTNKKTKKG